jgi:hypothetical protein
VGGWEEDAYIGIEVPVELAWAPCSAQPGGCRRGDSAYKHSCSEVEELASDVAGERGWSWVVASGRVNQAARDCRVAGTDAAHGMACRA